MTGVDEIRGEGAVTALDRTVRLFPDPAGGLRALVPVPLDTKKGIRTVRVKLGRERLEAKFQVIKRGEGKLQALRELKVNDNRALAMREDGVELRSFVRKVTPEARWSGPLRKPTAGRVTAVFGQRRVYGGGATWFHRGVDFAMQSGWPVVAVAPGRVVYAGRNHTYGNLVVLDHGQTVFTVYMHMKRLVAEEGMTVNEGQVIGTMGDTGFALGPHLHLSAYIAAVSVDPLDLLARGLP